MLLKCPSCGARCSAEAWENETYTMKALSIAARMPSVCGEHALHYIAMFRDPNASRSMSWQKAYNRLKELSVLINAGHVSVQGKSPVKCDASIWGSALAKIKERSLKLPLLNHRYLVKIAYELADSSGKAKYYREKTIQKAIDKNSMPANKTKPLEVKLTEEQQIAFAKAMADETSSTYMRMYNMLNDYEKTLKQTMGKDSHTFQFAMKRAFLKVVSGHE
jgi:hypothetical protein